ncbi:MAG: trypsin-like peptidase domain-containing protein [Bacteroidales bacterium]|nr:trypsin-like peptidase domain-containing protein [Bacteroidales bacterium]
MGNFIRWENIYAKNANATKQLAVTEQSLLEQWSKTGCSTIEGIYQCSKLGGETKMSRSMRLGIIYNKDIVAYEAIVLNEHDFWKVGDVIGELVPDEKEGLFVANYWRNRNKVPINSRLYAVFDINSMAIATKEASAEFVKIYPINSYGQPISNRWSGTGWALGNGYLVTNNHVAGEARSIIVKGIDGNYNTGYTAEVVATDKVNDIAILKINDSRFNGYGVLPYGVSARIADVGEDVFVLGYPLTQTMGYEIKLTNGIVSSLTGFKGDVSLYQMTAPIQPGNSGGPMFDKNGNVIGIVVSSHANAENVEYAIKTAYLKILIESAGLNIVFPNNNTISAMSLPEKVKRVKNFVYYIECSR